MQAVPALGFGNLVLVEGEGALAFYLEVLLRAALAQQGLGVVVLASVLRSLWRALSRSWRSFSARTGE